MIKREGEPWFVLADVCRVLEIANPSHAATRLDDDEKTTLANSEGRAGSGAQAFTIINESGLYSLVLTSRKPAAKRFKKWATGEVFPAIRKTGGYMVAAPEETPEQLALRALTVLQATVERQKAELAAALPKVEVHDRIIEADGSLTVTEAAKALQVAPRGS
ncbi:BRO family protein [Nitrospirillum sp. BR 11163]|uniref:BRO family protein n=1 Tax=Nitrospirillum sp. BR 11163 TaxID=3104323 RepID=UPI002AFE9631|nr:BRO family protein [Nitrospirillum sp. BR 11163]MEA1675252.1 BRO family protein [Nitrospirillum sp. BR 11163]